MRKFMVILQFCCMYVLSCMAQNLSVRLLEIAPMDMTAAHKPVKDLNGEACAVLKVQMVDHISKAEGNIVRRQDNGSETWLYLSPGTKYVKIIGARHKPLMVNIAEYYPGGVESKCTYILELDSDLPAQAIPGGEIPRLQPVKMSAGTDPLLPQWWNKTGDNLFVGISPPTLDIRRGQKMALSNAIGMYAMQSMQSTAFKFYMSHKYIDDENRYSDTLAIDYTVMILADIDILQEYCNHQGEYFVLCRIMPGNEGSSSHAQAVIGWRCDAASQSSAFSGKINATTSFEIKSRDWKADGVTSYGLTCEGDSTSGRLSCDGIEFTLPHTLSYPSSKSMGANPLTISAGNSLGFAQTRLIYLLPCVPEKIFCGRNYFQWNNTCEMEIRAEGKFIPRLIVMRDVSSDRLSFSIPQIPDVAVSRTAHSWLKNNVFKREIKKLQKEGIGIVPSGYYFYDMLDGECHGFGERIAEFGAIAAFFDCVQSYCEQQKQRVDATTSTNENKELTVEEQYYIDRAIAITAAEVVLPNLYWGLDASVAIRPVDWDNYRKHIVTILDLKAEN